MRAHALERRQQRTPVAVHVEESDGLGVDAELLPGPDLEQLLQGARTAGEGDECLRELAHPKLALVHVRYDVEACEAIVRDLVVHERAGHHPVDRAARSERGVGQHSHQTHLAAAVHDTDAPFRESAGELRRALGEDGRAAGGRSGEDRDPAGVLMVVRCGHASEPRASLTTIGETRPGPAGTGRLTGRHRRRAP